MRKLILLVLVSATLYGGYWFVGRGQVETRLTEALEQASDGPYDIHYDSLHTRGFPSRFDTTITDLSFADPTTGTTWAAPFFQMFALAYRPNEVIAQFPPEQTIGLGGVDYTLFTNDMRASGKVRPSANLAFQNATVTLDNPRLRAASGAELAMASMLAAMRLRPDTTQTYDAYIEARSIVLAEQIRRVLDPQNTLPPLVQNLRLDSALTLTDPIALISPSDTPPQVAEVTITELALTWGDIALTVIGDMAPDATGTLAGSVTITTRNWTQALDLVFASGVVDPDRRFLITEIARNLDETPQIADTLTLTLTIADGQMSVAGFPLGPIGTWR